MKVFSNEINTDTRAWLYYLSFGKYHIVEGTVRARHEYQLGNRTSFNEDNGRHWGVSFEPGVMYNGNVWLLERDDEKAKMIIRRYYDECIADLENRIQNYNRIIDQVMEL